MALVEISDVAMAPPNAELLWGRFLDHPKAGSDSDYYAIDLVGWIVGKKAPAVAVEVTSKGTEPRRIPLNVRRQDVASTFADAPNAIQSGFQYSISVLPMTADFELQLRAVLEDDTRVPMCTIRARRQTLFSSFQPRLQPLLFTNLGRSGSTWTNRLFGQHPQILTYEPFKYEPRIGSYWMEIFRTLAEPCSYLQPILAEVSNTHWWIGDKRQGPLPVNIEPAMRRAIGRTGVEAILAFCQERIEAFYHEVAQRQGREEPAYFAERYYGTSDFAMMMMWEAYPRAREIILIRDFRDMICSIFAFNKKTGTTMFGRENAANDVDFIRGRQGAIRGLLHNWKQKKDRAFLLHYEDLILRPEGTFAAALQYIGVDHRPETVKDVLQRAAELTPDRQEHHKTTKGPAESIGRWRRDLAPELQAACHETFGDVLKEFGYEVS
jgi:hypothetical protein